MNPEKTLQYMEILIGIIGLAMIVAILATIINVISTVYERMIDMGYPLRHLISWGITAAFAYVCAFWAGLYVIDMFFAYIFH